MKYVANGKIITQEEANKLEKRNMELLTQAEKTGDLDFLSDIVFILPLHLAIELSR